MSLRADLLDYVVKGMAVMYELDLTVYGGTVMRFYAGLNYVGANLLWQGQTYNAWPVEGAGFGWEQGQPTRPTLTVANGDGIISALCTQYRDFTRAKLTRRQTLAKYLDAGNFVGGVNPDADPQQEFTPQIYFIKRKAVEVPGKFVKFELGSALDIEGIKLPRDLVLSDLCTSRYRIWNGVAFSYANTTCPYAGTAYFDLQGNPTTAANDQCSHRLDTGCGRRYGAAPKPFGGFPGVGRLRNT
jgi:lambda family phage minor tail protein L